VLRLNYRLGIFGLGIFVVIVICNDPTTWTSRNVAIIGRIRWEGKVEKGKEVGGKNSYRLLA